MNSSSLQTLTFSRDVIEFFNLGPSINYVTFLGMGVDAR